MRKKNSLFIKVEKAQMGDEKAMEDILETVQPKVNMLLRQTSYQYRDDLKQEMNILLIEKVRKYRLDTVPGFDEFREMRKK